MKQIFELKGQGRSIRGIAGTLGISKNTVKKYLRSPGIPQARPRPRRPSLLDPFKEHIRARMAEGVFNCEVLFREIAALGYRGRKTILKDFVKPFRPPRQARATVRFETEPGECAQVDLGSFQYRTPEGRTWRLWAFVMVLSWSRALYVEFVPRADVGSFIRCHVNAFRHFGGVPTRCLYDNAKVVVLGRDGAGRPVFNPRFLDFSLRVGSDITLCRPRRAQTKGRVERAIRYIRDNFWPQARFTDVDDLNRQALAWVASVADRRLHGTTRERPVDRLALERPLLQPLPPPERLVAFLREDRQVGRDGFVQWEQSWYGVPCEWAGRKVQVQPHADLIELWDGDRRLIVHPRATAPGQRFRAPGQWAGLSIEDRSPPREPMAVQLPSVEVQRRPLKVYEEVAEVARR
ncbi:MAG: IS21 family transposase [Firmicutes bacterium]|nr:IS21 family transposase [Bacillota bacterium]